MDAERLHDFTRNVTSMNGSGEAGDLSGAIGSGGGGGAYAEKLYHRDAQGLHGGLRKKMA